MPYTCEHPFLSDSCIIAKSQARNILLADISKLLHMMRVTKTIYTVRDFVNWFRDGKLVLNPDFQRKSVWNASAKSFLIDSILKWIPVPLIFIREKVSENDPLNSDKEVVDWQQRLRTVLSFIDSDFFWRKMDRGIADDFTISKSHNPELQWMRFNNLPPDRQRDFMNYEFSVHILDRWITDGEVLDIFSRINSTWIKLNAQELLNAEFNWEFKQRVYSTAIRHYKKWEKWGTLDFRKIQRMDDAKMVNEFYALVLDWIQSNKWPSIKAYYKKYNDAFEAWEEASRRIDEVIEYIDSRFWNDLKKTSFKRWALLYALFATTYDKMFWINSDIANQWAHWQDPGLDREYILRLDDHLKNKDALSKELIMALGRGTNNIDSRKTIFKFISEFPKNG